MINCDAIFFSNKSEEILSQKFKLDEKKIGAFKSEIKDLHEIQSFHALSPNSYHLTYVSDLSLIHI